MNLSDIKKGQFKGVFDALEEAFTATGVDFYVIGAMARDVWYARAEKTSRMTYDSDFAVLVGSQQEYEAIREYLRTNENFVDVKGNSFVMLSPDGHQVDILPFGGMEIDDTVTVAGEGLSSIYVTGFKEVYETGTEEAEIRGHHWSIATLPAIVLLKFISFDDRPERRSKDARDIAGIIFDFFDLQPDLVYSNTDLFMDETDQRTMKDLAAIVIGREIKSIVESNSELYNRLIQILNEHIEGGEDSNFIRNMVAETNETVEVTVGYLRHLLTGLRE